MGGYSGKRKLGLWEGGTADPALRNEVDHEFTNYGEHLTSTGLRYFDVNTNVYGSTAANSPKVEIKDGFYYTFGASVYTYALSYNNRTGSGHMGIRQYDKDDNLVYYYMNGHYGRTTLTRSASPGDTKIYVASASGWYSGTSTNSNLAVFFPPDHPTYSTPYWYSRLSARYNLTTQGTPYTDIGGGEWEVNLTGSIPDWGYSLPVGTPVGNGRGTNANSYIITGNTNYNNFETWRTFQSGAKFGRSFDGGHFINGAKYARFLHLRNYTYRGESAGNSARYYIANIFALRRPTNRVLPTKLFQRKLPGPFY